MAVTAAQVKELRERTGGGMMDCQKALKETNGDMEKAIEYMRKTGLAKAAKKASRVAAEGTIIVATSANNKQAVIIEVNCETDFVARDEHFQQFCQTLRDLALAHQPADANALLAVTINGETVDALRQRLIVKIGENIHVRRCQTLTVTQGVLGSYIHGGRIGVIVAINQGNLDLAKDIAMHVAASNPECIRQEDVNPERVNAEKDIFSAQVKNSGKPADIIEKMVSGRIQKFVNEISLYGQPFVKDPSVTVGKLAAQAKADVTCFVRYEVGEGIDKQHVDFAAEVMAQVKGD